jgi:hypothetical protein
MALACAVVLALEIMVGPAAVRADDLTGVVLLVDPAGKKMVVLDRATSREIDISFVDRLDIQTTTGKPLQFYDLKRGDGVGVVLTGGLARRILVNQGVLKGVVSSIDLTGQKLVVTEEVTNRDVEVTLNPGTKIETGQHEPRALKDIKTGDGIGVVYSGSAPVDIMINSKPPEIKGHIKSIGGDMRSLVITELGSNAEVTVAITPKTTIVSNSGKTLGTNDLKKGDGVGIAHQASVASMIVVNPLTAH